MALVERRPATAAQESKLSLVFDGRIDLSPKIGFDAVNLKSIVILAIGVHSSEFEQVILPDRTETGIGGLVFAGCDGFDLVSSGVEHLTLL